MRGGTCHSPKQGAHLQRLINKQQQRETSGSGSRGGPAAQATSPMRSVLQRWGEESPLPTPGLQLPGAPSTGCAPRGIRLRHQPKAARRAGWGTCPGAPQGFKDRDVGSCQTQQWTGSAVGPRDSESQGMEPGKGQEKGSAARCHTSPAAGEEEGWAPSPQARRDSLEHPPVVRLLPPPSPILSPLGATRHPLPAGTPPELPCCRREGWGGQSALGTTRDTFYLSLKTLKLILET